MNPYYYEFFIRGSFYAFKLIFLYFLTHSYNYTQNSAFENLALLTAQCFVSPLISGYISDKYASSKTSFLIGILLQLCGFILVLHIDFLQIGFSFIVVSFGLTKTGILKLLKESPSYNNTDITKLYSITNLSAFVIPTTIGFIGENINWKYAIYLLVLVNSIILITFAYKFLKKDFHLKNLFQEFHFYFYLIIVWIVSYSTFYFDNIFLFLLIGISFIFINNRAEYKKL